MATFRKRPITVEAQQFIAPPGKNPVPPGMKFWPDESGYQPRDMSWGYVVTIHGQRAHVQDGDWIIREPDGEHHYPCKPDVFGATYEPIQEAESKQDQPTIPFMGHLIGLSTGGRCVHCGEHTERIRCHSDMGCRQKDTDRSTAQMQHELRELRDGMSKIYGLLWALPAGQPSGVQRALEIAVGLCRKMPMEAKPPGPPDPPRPAKRTEWA